MIKPTFLIVNFFACYMAADFLSGVLHWWEDRYINSQTPLLGKSIGEPNERHHREPSYFLGFSYWERIKISVLGVLTIGILLSSLGWMNWQIALTLLILSQANQVHALAHQGRTKNGQLVYFMQTIGLLQSNKEHAKHHTPPFNRNYCVISNWLNPLLSKLHFWTQLERIVKFIFKVEPLK